MYLQGTQVRVREDELEGPSEPGTVKEACPDLVYDAVYLVEWEDGSYGTFTHADLEKV